MDVFAPTGNLHAGAIWPEVVVTLTLLIVLVVDLVGRSAERGGGRPTGRTALCSRSPHSVP